jgi:hypothetical protein
MHAGTKQAGRRRDGMGDRLAIKRMIQRYRRLREWITDLQARRALRELIKSEEAKLGEEEDPHDEPPRGRPTTPPERE